MNKFLQTLIPLLFSLAFQIAVATNPPRTESESISFSYDFNGDHPTSLTYQGDAYFPSDSTYLRLTSLTAEGNPKTFSTGRVVRTSPILFKTGNSQADFGTTLKFVITPVDSIPADGLTFFIAPVDFGIPDGSTGGNFGIFNPSGTTPNVFAVEFDITKNTWDPDFKHVGINIESSVSKVLERVDDAIVGQEVTARINYVGATNVISVSVAAGEQSFEVDYVMDLSSVLTEQVQVGISGTTGSHVAIYDVMSWNFTSTIVTSGVSHISQVV